jgi:cell division protein FtsQ
MAVDDWEQAHPDIGTRSRPGTGARVGVISIGAVVLLLATAWALTFTSLFHAKVVTVQGAHKLNSRKIMSLAGVFPGVDVFHLDAGGAVRKLEQDPWIASATVVKRLPSTIVISVVERAPVALVRDAAGSLSLVAADGVLLGPATGNEVLPTIAGANPSSIPDAATVREAASVAGSFSPALLTGTGSVVIGSDATIQLILRSSVVASYGTPDQLSAKGQALEAVLAWANRNAKQLAAIDVTVPSAPTATTAGGVITKP